MKLGIERLLTEAKLKQGLKGKKVSLLGHPASVTQDLTHSLDALRAMGEIKVESAFGPQHGMRGEKQDNMIESEDYLDPIHGIPVFSLYGKVRRPTDEMLASFDVLLVDLQDVGCRIYTFLTTLFYMMDALHAQGDKEIWVLDRPNPVGRPVEGHRLDMQFQSFVGAAPVPMRHGLTLGEAALWYREWAKLDVNLKVIEMTDYNPETSPGWGWPIQELPWVNPSPNMPRLSTARCYAGTVLLEGTLISEGRGTTIPLENFGAPQLKHNEILNWMKSEVPSWLGGCKLRLAFYEPTFHKFKGQLVSGLQIHVDGPWYDHSAFKPYRIVAAFLRAVREFHPQMEIWLQPPYEYEKVHLPITILSGGHQLRGFIEGESYTANQFDQDMRTHEDSWLSEREPFLLY